ncbi:class I SAM-dependent DNA methyltransferase [Rhodococcus sp. NPDC058521]|uniref:class I SAM-dependent DNA methyltransferase n=1 Tax=Rhodococcus sp. NPDC058521 TaxID=3346536 RepID=UPI003663CA2F
MIPTVTRNLLTDNPALYEARFPDPDHAAGRFVDDIARTLLSDDRSRLSVLDLGCGTGRDLGFLAGQGYRCHGLDMSEQMVRYAAAEHAPVTASVDDLRDFDLQKSFDVITCLDSSLLYCHTDTELASALGCARNHLRSDGLLIAEMRNGAFFLGNTELLDVPTLTSFDWEGRVWSAETTLWIDHASQLLRRRRAWTLPDSSEPLVQTSAWRLLFPLELAGHLERAGFSVWAMFDTPGPRTDPGWIPVSNLEGLRDSPLSGDRLHVVARAV